MSVVVGWKMTYPARSDTGQLETVLALLLVVRRNTTVIMVLESQVYPRFIGAWDLKYSRVAIVVIYRI